MASYNPPKEEENIIEFNIGELGVADTGGSIALNCQGVKCRLDVPPGIPVGTLIRINCTASMNTTESSSIGMNTLEDFHQPDTNLHRAYEAQNMPVKKVTKEKKKWNGALSAEQQLVLASIIIGVVGLGVGVGILSQNTSLWEKPGVGVSILLAIIFAALIAAIESGFANILQLPLIESSASIVSTFIIFSLFLSIEGYIALWVLGIGFVFTSLFHSFHVRITHKKYDIITPSSWFSTRLVLLFTPFVFLWFGIILSFGWAESSKPFLLMAAVGAYVLVGVGTLAPTMMYLDCENMSVPANPLQYFAQQENTLLLWVLLNGLTVCLIALKGGARLHAPIAQLIPASVFFMAVASPLIPAYPSPPNASMIPPTVLFNLKLHRPRGIASIVLALFCLMICIGSRAVAGSDEPSAALASFGALLIGTISHHVVESEDLETARVSLAAILLICSFWTGRYTSVFTESFACLIWGSLQLPLWHDLIDSRKDENMLKNDDLNSNKTGASGGRLAKRMSLNPMQLKPGETNTMILNLRWYEKSIKPSLFLIGMVLCMGSFVLTDWIDRYYNASAGFLMARGVFSVLIPPVVAAIANERRSVKDVLTTGDGDCILIAITVPFIAAFASSGPWYENTKYLSLIYSFFVLVSIRLTNHSEIWSSRDINMNPKYLDFAIYVLFFILCVSTFSNYLFNVQNWVITLLAFLFAGFEGVAIKDAYTRIAMFRPPILGSLILFLFAILTDGYRARNDDDTNETMMTVLPLLLLLPLFFICCGIGGRVYVSVPLNRLRIDIALASIYFAICAAPFAGFIVAPEVEYNYKKNSNDDLKSSFVPNSAWVLMGVLMVGMIGEFLLLKLTPNNEILSSKKNHITNHVNDDQEKEEAASADDGDITSLVESGKSSSSSTFQSLSNSSSSFELNSKIGNKNESSENDMEENNGEFNGRDTLVSGGLAFIGSISVEMPLALVMGTMFGVLWARERKSLHGAVLATFIFLCRGVLQLFNNLYGFSTVFWLLMYGCFMLFLVALWPMPELLGSSNMGAGAAVLRLVFVAAAVMMVGPATDGWGSLAAIIFFTAVYIKSTESGVLRAAVFTPLLYFGSFAMIIHSYDEDEYLSLASFITSLLSLICALVLRFMAKNENDEAVSHFLIYFIFMPFGLGCTSQDFNYVPLVVSTMVSIWAYCHINKHTSAAVFLVSIIPFIMLTSVATLVNKEDKYIARGMLALTAGLWGLKLVIVYFVMKSNGSLDQTIKESSNAVTPSTKESTSSSTSVGFSFTNSFGDCMKYVNALGNGCLEQFSACGMLWLLASFVFMDGYPALAFAGALCLFLMAQMFLNNHKWYLLVLLCSIAVTVASFEIDIGNGLIWLDPYGATAIVSLVTLPLPWLLTMLTPKNNFITLSLAPFIACFVIIPFGFTGSIATKGVLSVVSVATVVVWTSITPYYAALGCSILPNFAIVAGALLRHGGEGPMLVGDRLGSLLPGSALACCGVYYVMYGTCMSKKQELLLNIQKQQQLNDNDDENNPNEQVVEVPFYLDWVPPHYMQECGAFVLLLGLCYGISGFIGVVALFLLAIFVGAASMLDKKNAEAANTNTAVSETGIVNEDEALKASSAARVVKQQFAQVSVFLIFLATAMGVSYGEKCVHGIAATELAAVACVSIAGFVLVAFATIVDRNAQSIPWHIRDFLIYLWFVIGGLIGAAANDLGSLGVIVIVIGAIWSFYRHHSLICVLVAPSLMFWAGLNLNKATGNVEPCIAIGTPVLIYAICELIAAQVLRMTRKDVILKGPGAIPISWANPKEIVPRYFSSSLEISGALFLIAGCMGLMYCPGDKGGSLGVAGQLAFIGLLVIMGVYLLRHGLILRDEQDAETGRSGSSSGLVGVKTQGLRLRVAGLLLINAAIWFAFPLTSSLALKAVVIVLGSMVLIISGCVSMYWKKDVDALTTSAMATQEGAARNETLDNANAL